LISVPFYILSATYGLLDFYDDSNESSEAIFKQIVPITENNGLSVSQISAYGADNASVNMVGTTQFFRNSEKLTHKL